MDNEINRQWREIAIVDTVKFIATQSDRVFSDEEFLELAKKVYNFMVSSENMEKTFEFSNDGSPFVKPEIKIKVEVGEA